MEKVIGESVKETNQTFLRTYVQEYCDALTKNFELDSIRGYEYNLKRDPECTYSADRLNDIQNGNANLNRFRFIEGKKYYKVVMQEFDTFQDKNEWRDTTVHSFVDKNTGDVFKPASWKAPATKHVRYSFCNMTDFKMLLNPRQLDWAGGYLYMR